MVYLCSFVMKSYPGHGGCVLRDVFDDGDAFVMR